MKKVILSFLIANIVLCFGFSPANAQDSTFLEDNLDETRLDAPTNLGKFSDETIYRSAATLIRGFAGDQIAISLGKNIPYAYNPSTYYGKGVIPSMVDYTAYLMNRPVKTADYIADVMHNTGIVKQTYAQGVGFAGLTPILNIWKGFRNLTYFLFIIIFVVVGFMIMFRKKVGSNTIVTIQEALPKIIVTLLLITFSYAIAGLVIDLMYLSIFILAGLLKTSGIITDSQSALSVLFNKNIIGIGLKYFAGTGEVAGVAAESMGQLISQALDSMLGGVANIIFYLIFLVAIIIAVFKTFIQLVTAYVGIILSTIFAPLQLLPNAFPGSDAFSKWLRGLVANAVVFPVTCAIVLIGASITGRNPNILGTGNSNDLGSLISPDAAVGFQHGGFIPPLLSSNSNRGAGSVNAVRGLIGFGMIMLLPEIVKIVKEALQVKEPAYGDMAIKGATTGWKGINWTGQKLFGRSQTEKLSEAGLLTRRNYYLPLVETEGPNKGKPVINPKTNRREWGARKIGGWWPF